jgi:16S rRNA (guanine966-N2)-methyltransferase
MRVIAGEYRSRVLQAPQGLDTTPHHAKGGRVVGPVTTSHHVKGGRVGGPVTRPTSDRLRETLFNVLASRVEGAAFLDLYAGSGAVGIEALSRGAREAIFVEQAEPALRAIRRNLASLGIRGRYALEPRSVAAGLRRLAEAGRAADLVFLDPPYAREEEYALALGLLGGECKGVLAGEAWVIAEHEKRRDLEERYGKLVRFRVLKQGDAALSFYRVGAGMG